MYEIWLFIFKLIFFTWSQMGLMTLFPFSVDLCEFVLAAAGSMSPRPLSPHPKNSQLQNTFGMQHLYFIASLFVQVVLFLKCWPVNKKWIHIYFGFTFTLFNKGLENGKAQLDRSLLLKIVVHRWAITATLCYCELNSSRKIEISVINKKFCMC